MKSEIKNIKLYSLYFDYSFDEDNQEFSQGKLLHVVQNICRHYVDSFYVLPDEVYVYNNGDFHRTFRFQIQFSYFDDAIADRIAEDVCAILNLDAVQILVTEGKKYRIIERL